MQTVSQDWKYEQEQLFVGESFINVRLNLSDPESSRNNTTADNGHESYSGNISSLALPVRRKPIKYTTLETNMWVLDDTPKTLVGALNSNDNGYIGNMVSDTDGSFHDSLADGTPTPDNKIPIITISFTKVYDTTIPGMTITWSTTYNEWATKYRIKAYNNNDIVAEITVDNDLVTSSALFDLQNYNKITIEILSWSWPGHRPRIEQIIVGLISTFTKSDLLEYSQSMIVDPLSATLPKTEISFKLLNLDSEYNLENPQGMTKYLIERQLVEVDYGYTFNGNEESITGATVFLSEWETPQNGISATFKARDLLEYMSDKYTGESSGTLFDIATSAFEQANLPFTTDNTNRWYIDSSLSTISAATGQDLSNYTLSQVVQLCANAACCVFYPTRQGLLRIEPLHTNVTDYSISQFNSYQNSNIVLTKQLKSVNINNDMYVLNVGEVGETQPVNNPLISSERAPIVAQWVADYLKNRKTYNGSFRADPRLDPLDRITNTNQFAESTVLVTQIDYTYNGGFKGNYQGRSGV